MILDGYIRVSEVRGRAGDTFISPEVQREKIAAYAALHGHTVARFWVELDRTGRNTARPMFQQVIERIEAGETGGIAVAKLDRFARSLVGAMEAVTRIEAAGGQLVSVEDSFDTSTPIGRFGFQVMLALGELESGRIRDNWRVASERAVARGVHQTPRVPVGYQRGDDGRLQVDEVAGPLIRRAFEQRAAGVPSGEVAAMLNDAGVRTSYGGGWIGATVRRLTENRVYLGEARGSFGASNAAAHDPLIDQDTFAAVQVARDRGVAKNASLLAGLLRCAGCRYAMSRDFSKTPRYRCRVEHTTGRCPAPTAVHPHVIEAYVVGELFDRTDDELKRIRTSQPNLAPLQVALDAADRELALYRDTAQIAQLGQELFLEGLQARVDARNRAHQLLASTVDDAGGLAAFDRVAWLREEWDDLELDEKRELLAATIDVVFLRRGRIAISDRCVILWRGQGPVDLPRRAKPAPIRSFDVDDVAAGVAAAEDLSERRTERAARLDG